MRVLVVLALIFVCPASAYAEEPAKTVVHDKVEAQILLGTHLFTESSLSVPQYTTVYTDFGSAQILNVNGVYKISGQHEIYRPGYKKPDFVDGGFIKIEGVITSIKADEFTVDGTLDFQKTNSLKDFPGYHCQKTSPLIFSRRGHPKYWRLNLTCQCPSYDGQERWDASIDLFSSPLSQPVISDSLPSPFKSLRIFECTPQLTHQKNN